MMDYLPWIVVAAATLLLIVLFIVLMRERKNGKLWYVRYKEHEPYYVDSADRGALANFIADHLDDLGHPNRHDVVRILTRWSSEK